MIRFRPLPGLTLAAALGTALLIALGVWQLQRLTWKTELIKAAEARAHLVPVELMSLLGRPASEIEYAHARATGEFLSGEAYLFTTLEDERVGFEVVAPFQLENGTIILVDRGFVSATGSKVDVHEGAPKGEVEITGLVRAPQKPQRFTPKPDLERRTWYGRDAAAMSHALGLPSAAPLFLALDAGPAGGAPEGGHTKLTFRNEHLHYALTWFALAGVLVGVYLAYHRSKGRLQF